MRYVLAGDAAVANQEAVVIYGDARFTVLTDRLIRMEWAKNGYFEDAASLGIICRDLPVPEFTARESRSGLTIKTDKLTLMYKGGRFASDNLCVTFRLNGRHIVWRPGADDAGNLKGTARTLDGSLGFSRLSNSETQLEDGILSRDGWAIVDESARPLLRKDNSDWGEWVCERPKGDRIDEYIFAYGHDYLQALSDFTKVAGKIPLPPKYVFGYWWSRYWAYSDKELLSLADEMRSRGIPADVFVIDMDWHKTWPELGKARVRDEFGQSRGWTGYTWNRDLIPEPDSLLSALHRRGFKTALNLHPASGIQPYEDCYAPFVKDYLSRTDDYDGPQGYVYGRGGYRFAGNLGASGQSGHQAPVPFRLDQQAWADAYFNSVIRPLERQGVDFWWLDWQQWHESKYVGGLSNTFWCNYAFWSDKVRQTRERGLEADRPLIYHRWGGLGSHRYQVGFSGDTYDEWSVLQFLPYFTATASNVGYGYWGHDIGGHMQLSDHQRPRDPEMYTRWMQFAVFTPIFKTHSTKSDRMDCRIWSYPAHYQYLKDAIELRYALSPYIYDAARQAYDTGVSICRPLYYYHPEEEEAYSHNEEYFFGDNILTSVICTPVDETGFASRKVWLPSGSKWYDMAHGQLLDGGSVVDLQYAIDQIPWFVREGAVIPLAEEGIQNLQTPSNRLRLLVVPGRAACRIEHYEDDGVSQSYERDYAKTTIKKTVSGGRLRLSIGACRGTFAGASDTRRISVLLEGVGSMPSRVELDGAALPSSCVRVECGRVVIDLPERPATEKIDLDIR